jgi:hypothetical protein
LTADLAVRRCRLDVPCILEEPGSTTQVEPEMTADVLADGQLLIAVEGSQSTASSA